MKLIVAIGGAMEARLWRRKKKKKEREIGRR